MIEWIILVGLGLFTLGLVLKSRKNERDYLKHPFKPKSEVQKSTFDEALQRAQAKKREKP